MNKCFYTLLMFIIIVGFAQFAYSTTIHTTVIDVHDGDTFKVLIPGHPKELQYLSVRVYGINTPELSSSLYEKTGKVKKGSCTMEADLAISAKKYLQHILRMNNNEVSLILIDYDKFGGRVLAKVFVGNVNVAEEMIAKGFAVPYFGEAKTNPWCNKEE